MMINNIAIMGTKYIREEDLTSTLTVALGTTVD